MRRFLTVLRLLLVLVHKHIHRDVGVEQMVFEVSQIRLGHRFGALCRLVADCVCPLKVDVDLVDGVELGGEDIAVDLDVGEGVDRGCLRTLRVFPYYGPVRGGGLCGVCFIVVDVNL